MSLLQHVVHYFTKTWKDSGTSGDDTRLDIAQQRFVGDFLEGALRDALGPFHGAADESFALSCERSSGALSLTIPGGGNSHQGWNPWVVGASTAVGSASIDLGSNELCWSLDSGDVEVTSARSDVGSVMVRGAYDNNSQTVTATLKVGPLATRVAVAPTCHTPPDSFGRSPSALTSSPFLARYNIISEFSALFPCGVSSHLPNLRFGVRTSNDAEEAPVVLGCTMWPGRGSRSWSLAAVLSLTSLIHLQCSDSAGIIGQYLSSSRGAGKWGSLGNVREDDQLSFAGQQQLAGGDVTGSWLVSMPVGPRLFQSHHAWGSYWRHEVSGKLGLEWDTTVAQFPSKIRVSAHSNGSVCSGFEMSVPSFTTGLGAMWDGDDRRVKFGLEISC
jgi:hypothetical protein